MALRSLPRLSSVFLHFLQVAGSQLEQARPSLRQAQLLRREQDCVRGHEQQGVALAVAADARLLRRFGTGEAVEEASSEGVELCEDDWVLPQIN